MPGKEKVVACENAVKNFFIKKNGTYYYMSRERADVGETDKN